ncbi:MAG: TM2 domain-containing protein [Methanobrevibacter sp.]|uniref:zinc ribbon domain-containing protein n=1 Tax=Methanobrevibacter sp. TaxID=66852 RepID=UPI0025E9B7AE|nr:zinc ribbon domain-containing protein [Methanobrevibacter sp.]MBR0270729.1 TM2 domain-containing protein [Methanobrevibacter sp.]
MFCDNCGTELDENAQYCNKCGNKVNNTHFIKKEKNMYLALILSFIFAGLGIIYAGNTKKGLIFIALRIITAAIGVFIFIFIFISILIWAYGLYETYNEVKIANGVRNPNILNDFKNWNSSKKCLAIIVVSIVLIVMVSGVYTMLDAYYGYDDSPTYYSSSSSGSSSSGGYSSSSGHYGGVDTSPSTIARNDPGSYYDYYNYGDNDEIDEYLESQGFD